MISDQRTITADSGYRSPVQAHSPTLSLSPSAGTPSPTTPLSHHGYSCQIFNFDQLTVRSSPGKISSAHSPTTRQAVSGVATVIPPPHQQISRSASSSSSSAAASATSQHHQSIVNSSQSFSSGFIPPYHPTSHTTTQPDVQQRNQIAIDSPSQQYPVGAFIRTDSSPVQSRYCFDSNNNNNNINNSSACNNTISLHTDNNRFASSFSPSSNQLSPDLQGIPTIDFENIENINIHHNRSIDSTISSSNNNNNNNNNNIVRYESLRRHNNANTIGSNSYLGDFSTKPAALPSVNTFLGRIPKEEPSDQHCLYLSDPNMVDTVPNAILAGDDEEEMKEEYSGSPHSSSSSMEDIEGTGTSYMLTNLTNVVSSLYNGDYMDEAWTVGGTDFCGLVKPEPFQDEPVDPLDSSYAPYIFSPPHDSDYDSSCAEHGGVHGGAAEYGGFPHSYYHRYMRNDGNAEAALPMHQQMVEKYDYPHPSPMSDEGFVDGTNITEENLPDFAKIQHLPVESDRQPVRRRSSSSSPKVKKVPRDLQPVAEKERRKPGRKPGQVSNVLHLWEFMRDLLQSPDNPGIIEWISKADGVFRVVNSTEVARLWGEKKKNKKKMTYEKLSRSLRYSRLEGYFSDLPKDKNYPKKLCFKFGPKSKDWH